MLKTALDAVTFMRTGTRVSPSWPGPRAHRPDTLKQTDHRRPRSSPLQTGRAIRFNSIDPSLLFTSCTKLCSLRNGEGGLGFSGETRHGTEQNDAKSPTEHRYTSKKETRPAFQSLTMVFVREIFIKLYV